MTNCNVGFPRKCRKTPHAGEGISDLGLFDVVVNGAEVVVRPRRDEVTLAVVVMAQKAKVVPSVVLGLVIGGRVFEHVSGTLLTQAVHGREVFTVTPCILEDNGLLGCLGLVSCLRRLGPL